MDDPQKSDPSPIDDFNLWISDRLGDVDQILRKMDLSSPRVRWKLHQWQEDLRANQRRREEAAQRGPAPVLCPSCGLVAGIDNTECPYCHKPLTGWRATLGGIRRSLSQNDSSEGSSVSQLLLFTMIGIFVLGLGLSLTQSGGQGFNGGSSSILHNAWVFSPRRVLQGELWRLITPLFLHGGFMHIIFNGMALAQIGPQIEAQFGSSRFTALFLFSGLAGHIGSTLWYRGSVNSLGASGAIFGLIGVLYVSARVFGGPGASLSREIAKKWIMYGLIFGFLVPGIDNGAHVGGLVGGGLATLVLGDPMARSWRTVPGKILGYASGVLMIAVLLWGLVEAFVIG